MTGQMTDHLRILRKLREENRTIADCHAGLMNFRPKNDGERCSSGANRATTLSALLTKPLLTETHANGRKTTTSRKNVPRKRKTVDSNHEERLPAPAGCWSQDLIGQSDPASALKIRQFGNVLASLDRHFGESNNKLGQSQTVDGSALQAYMANWLYSFNKLTGEKQQQTDNFNANGKHSTAADGSLLNIAAAHLSQYTIAAAAFQYLMNNENAVKLSSTTAVHQTQKCPFPIIQRMLSALELHEDQNGRQRTVKLEQRPMLNPNASEVADPKELEKAETNSDGAVDLSIRGKSAQRKRSRNDGEAGARTSAVKLEDIERNSSLHWRAFTSENVAKWIFECTKSSMLSMTSLNVSLEHQVSIIKSCWHRLLITHMIENDFDPTGDLNDNNPSHTDIQYRFQRLRSLIVKGAELRMSKQIYQALRTIILLKEARMQADNEEIRQAETDIQSRLEGYFTSNRYNTKNAELNYCRFLLFIPRLYNPEHRSIFARYCWNQIVDMNTEDCRKFIRHKLQNKDPNPICNS